MKIICLIVGIILCSIGISFLVIYANLLGSAYGIKDYVMLFIKGGDFIYLIGGIGLIFYALKK